MRTLGHPVSAAAASSFKMMPWVSGLLAGFSVPQLPSRDCSEAVGTGGMDGSTCSAGKRQREQSL